MTFHELETDLDDADACEEYRLAALDSRPSRLDSLGYLLAAMGVGVALGLVLAAMCWK